MKVNGYIKPSFSYTPSDTDDKSNFKVGNARLKFTGKLLSWTNYGIQVDMVRDDILLDAIYRSQSDSFGCNKVRQVQNAVQHR
ncbi:hypothetical protein ACFL1R_12450 [Candidatus Latescibacterota bacterium]